MWRRFLGSNKNNQGIRYGGPLAQNFVVEVNGDWFVRDFPLIVPIIYHLHCYRKQRTCVNELKLNELSGELPITHGVPQGSILGPCCLPSILTDLPSVSVLPCITLCRRHGYLLHWFIVSRNEL